MIEHYWWLFPLLMMALCFLVMRGRGCSMMCGFGPRAGDRRETGRPGATAGNPNKREE